MQNNKKYIVLLRWIVFIVLIFTSYIFDANNIEIFTSAKFLPLIAALFLIYLVIVTSLYRTYPANDFFYFYSLCVDAIFAIILFSMVKINPNPFVFIFYLIIIASACLEIKLLYRLIIPVGLIAFYAMLNITGASGLEQNLTFFIINLFGLIFTCFISFLLFSSDTFTEKITKAHLKQLESAYKVSREQSKAKEEKELILIDKSQKLLSLIEISRSMGAITRLDELLELIVNKARETLNTKISFIMLIKDKELKIVYSLGLSEITKNVFKNKVGEGLFGEAAAKNKIVNINLKDNSSHMQPFYNTFEKIKNILCIPLISQDKNLIGMIGAANLLMEEKFSEEQVGYLYTLATDASIFVRNRILFEELERSYIEMIQALAQAVEARDPYTYGHVDRVMHYSVLLAKKLGANQTEIDLIKTSAVLHDLGKIGTPDNILLKPSGLTDDERSVMNKHVTKSADILRNISSLNPKVLDIVRHHHERYDGEGYPDKLKGDQIPIEAQIISIADTYDAMTSDRPYRKGFVPEKAVMILKEVSGRQFNPKIVDAFVELYNSGSLTEKEIT